eukprot:11868720-Alexandrium_andersonii.AAC.1
MFAEAHAAEINKFSKEAVVVQDTLLILQHVIAADLPEAFKEVQAKAKESIGDLRNNFVVGCFKL